MNDGQDISNHAGPTSAAEPSMEEILASIRRILKEDDGGRGDADDDLLVLDSSMLAPPADISSATMLPVDTGLVAAHDQAPLTSYHEPLHFAPTPDVEGPDEARPEPAAASEETMVETRMTEQVQGPNSLLSQQVKDAVASTVGSLVRSISHERAVSVGRGGLTIEDIVREEIKPVLKAWLDTHLPTLVERIVRTEIERVVEQSKE
jgi:cell pole-organizing protein PopZ